jgi:hypothetical protein
VNRRKIEDIEADASHEQPKEKQVMKKKVLAALAFTLASLAAMPSAAKADSVTFSFSSGAPVWRPVVWERPAPVIWTPAPVAYVRPYCPPRQVVVMPPRPVVYYYPHHYERAHFNRGWGHGHGYGRHW